VRAENAFAANAFVVIVANGTSVSKCALEELPRNSAVVEPGDAPPLLSIVRPTSILLPAQSC